MKKHDPEMKQGRTVQPVFPEVLFTQVNSDAAPYNPRSSMSHPAAMWIGTAPHRSDDGLNASAMWGAGRMSQRHTTQP